VFKVGVVLFADCALAFAMQMQKVAKVFCEVVDRVHGELDSEVSSVGVGDRDLQDSFSAPVEFT